MRVRQNETRRRALGNEARPDDLAVRPEDGSSPATDPEAGTTAVHYGIHVARYPLRGLTIAQARRVLSPMMNIDPEAVAVLRGEIIDDEEAHVLSGEEEMLGFVKRSSVKGAA